MALTTKPLGGMRQRYPDELRLEAYVTDALREASTLSGFDQYDGPVLEPLSLFAAKSGSELVERQSYSFLDKGDRQVILRPEMTPSLARMVAAKGELHLPVRWFSMPLCYRYERPQRGRVREFLQYNCDILGSEYLAAELEIIQLLGSIMKSLGARPSIYSIGWSSRRFMSEALKRSGVKSEFLQTVFSAIDKKDKMKPEIWSDHLLESCGGSADVCHVLKRLVEVDSVSDPWLASLMSDSPDYSEIVAFQALLEATGVESTQFSPSVVRGLDYYTGIVFELMDTGGENRRAICGGGRYDNLVGLFGKKKISGVGFGMGVLTLTLFLETYSLIPDWVKSPSSADMYIAVFSPSELSAAAVLASFFREQGLRVMMDVSGKKLGKQYAEASRQGIPALITVGPDEVSSGEYKVKQLDQGREFSGTPLEIYRHMTGADE